MLIQLKYNKILKLYEMGSVSKKAEENNFMSIVKGNKLKCAIKSVAV